MNMITTQAEPLTQTVKTLLALRGESLMSACIKASERAQCKVDYGNASSWLRGVPGRLGVAKLEILLDYLGLKEYRLDAQRIHWWRLPSNEDNQQGREALLQFLQDYAALPTRTLWLRTPQKAFLGLALEAAGVAIVFRVSKDCNQVDLQAWLNTLPQPCVMLEEAVGVKSVPMWDDFLHARETPERLWQMEKSENERAWQAVIETLKARGITPEDVLALVERDTSAHETCGAAIEPPTEIDEAWIIDSDDLDLIFRDDR